MNDAVEKKWLGDLPDKPTTRLICEGGIKCYDKINGEWVRIEFEFQNK
jgi:hypothetical protein